MIVLPSTDKIQLVSSAAVTLDVLTSYVDASNAVPPVVQGDTIGRTVAAITTATTTDIVPAPAASELRRVKTINVRNKHATTSCDVTIVLDVSGTDYELFKVTLRAGEVLQWREELGFYVIPASDLARRKLLTADQANATTTPAEVTGLTLLTGLGTFVFDYYIIGQTGATTTGFGFGVNHDGTVTQFVWDQRWVTNISTASDDVIDQDMIAAAGGVVSAFSSRAKFATARGTITDVDTANADVLIRISGIFTCTVDGNLELWHASDVAATSTVKAGSALLLEKIA